MPHFNRANRSRLKGLFNGFFRREDGVISVEAMLILPMLFWSMFASYTYYDSYRQSARNIKGAYAIADIISREDGDINTKYIDTLYDLLNEMVYTRSPVSMRVSYIEYIGNNSGVMAHNVVWSCVRGTTYPQLINSEIDKIKHRIPVMPANGSMIIVETKNTYKAPFQMGFEFADFEMDNFVFTHPRVFDQVVNTPCKIS
ncbi:hypothetical protein RA27_01880 [Ruegeria sp. ANG-R]|uniref:TadE/TadG family type IV pilus assembly protein n=1 Tax=Ruegeria sp. ANG-R TaxID=1577903 RepID=UPI00057CBE82|nr:hypothetical protein [Ruegeria sp. ANG-R]KIC42170.1 hypothetical protein RA27_01880 [Ruegeria sp. ANG-R]